MRPQAILETALYAPDLDAAEAFYGALLGLPKVTRAGDRHVFFRLRGSMRLSTLFRWLKQQRDRQRSVT